MGTLKIYAADSAVIKYSAPSSNFHAATLLEAADLAIVTFKPTESQLAMIRGHRITSEKIYAYATYRYSSSTTTDVYILNEAVNINAVTYNTRPMSMWGGRCQIYGPTSLQPSGYYGTEIGRRGEDLQKTFDYGVLMQAGGVDIQTAKGTNKPYIEITYEDKTATPEIVSRYKQTVRASEIDQIFRWLLRWNEQYIYGEAPTVASMKMIWRAKNASTTHAKEVDPDETEVTISAGTLPTGALEWTVQVTTSLGATAQANWEEIEVKTPEIKGMTPAVGAYTPKHAAGVFAWDIQQPNGATYASAEQKNATIKWRKNGATATHSIQVAGTAKTYTVPADTFADNSIDWMVTATTAAGGLTVSSPWVTVSTVEEAPSAKPISPSGIVIDATIVNRFSWQHIISTGTPQSKADVQWSADGETWNTLATVTGENQYYDAPANTFASGTKYWRVRTYNTDGAASEWSDKAEFIAINAPAAPSIAVQSTSARPRITWQTTEQEAYELTLSNGYAAGTVYGTEKTWRAPAYLQDGSYTVRVRVQNKYGMWSEWGAAALPVSHTEGESITLTVSTDQEAAILWQTAGSYDFYLVERDGEVIARTTQKEYIDRTSVGEATYRVRGCYKNTDDYGLSAAQTVTVLPDTIMICDLESGTWQRLPLSETILRTSRAYRAASIATVHLSGLAYPVAERTEFLDMTLQISCAFTRKNRAAALALESLVGRLVCAKTKQGDMVTGYMTALEKNADEIMSRYSFEIANLHRKETIDIDT